MNTNPDPRRTPGPGRDPLDNATLTTKDGRTALRMERGLAHPPERVWAALTDPAALRKWFPAEVTLDLAPGGSVEFRFPGADADTAMAGTVTDAEEPRLFAFTWGTDHLSWSIAPDGDGSLLTLVHTFGDLPGAASFASGWHLCLTALAQLLDGVTVAPGRDTGALHESYLHGFGLDQGTVTVAEEETAEAGGTGGAVKRVRFERQLVRPAETVWQVLSAGIVPVAGLPVPEGFTAGSVPAGPVTEVRPPRSLTYRWGPDATVTWELSEGTGHGARLVLTQTGPESFDTDTALAVWRARIDRLAAALLDR
ncbi:SRPBCC family protein [Streptomyces sp. NPDC012623]|uniref:SRPBCC family protein n=1 Tax=unclassified Streptomyces TaxID=2593676 RepID=UPI0036B49200